MHVQLPDGLTDKLEVFKVKRMLKWLKHRSNTAAITALEMPTMRSRLLVIELSFLQWVMESKSGSLSGQALGALCDNVARIYVFSERV